MLKVVRLDQVANTGNRTVTQLLEDEIGEQENRGNPDKAIIIYLNTAEDQYSVGWSQAGLKMSECVSLLDIAKDMFKREMNY